ncbi:hypothetical protein FRB96_008688 [Tulasnella sp. 330]|nr:hypothetical protein FRB96_008688 [Tulasnella sp. 330]
MPPRRSTRGPATEAASTTAARGASTLTSTSKRRVTKVKDEPVEDPSLTTDDQDEPHDEEEEQAPRKTRKSATGKRAGGPLAKPPAKRPSRDKAAAVKVEEPDEEKRVAGLDGTGSEKEEPAPMPPSTKSRMTTRKSAPASKASTTGKGKSRSKRVAQSESDSDARSDHTAQPNGHSRASQGEDEGDDDDFDALGSKKPSTSKRTTQTSTNRKVSNGKSAARPSSSSKVPVNKTVSTPRKSVKSEPVESRAEIADEDDIPDFDPSRASSRAPATPRPVRASVEDDEKESSEEEDLLASIRNQTPKRGASHAPSMTNAGRNRAPSPAKMDGLLEQKPEESELPKGPSTRLVIHKMVLINFKSYAGRQEIGPFHKSFSSIVGPNGSGKSNTIDALLFVFGYRASKMRQGKLSELIHNSAEHPDLDECRVEVWFREIEDLPGPDAYRVVPNSRLIVARSATRNNSSTYTINNERSNFTEVTTLLKERGIDLDHKRFLILQGEVESIAQMKPKALNEHEDGLLEYLEDIIGTSRYKESIDTTLIEVDQLNEERSEKLNRLRVVERDKDGLEEKKKEAETWLRNKNELIRAQNKLYQWYLHGHVHQESELRQATGTLTTQLAQEKEKNADNVAGIEALERNYDERVKAFEVVKKELAPLAKQLQNLEKQEVQLGEKRKHIMTKGKKLTKSLREDIHGKNEAEDWVKNHTEMIERKREEVEALEQSLEKEELELEKITDGLKGKTDVFHAQIETKQKELEPWNAKINKKQAEVDLATNERDMLAEKANAVKSSVSDANKNLEDLTIDKEAKEAELQERKTELNSLKKNITAGEKKLQNLEEEEQHLRSKASGARQKTDEAKASQAANRSQNQVSEVLNRLKSTGRLTGFHGRLGDLGTIPEKYDVAMSTACPALNNYVVDEVKQGEACIAYLKQQNVGRASFYVLEKLGKAIPSVATPENAPRLFDLVTPRDPKLAPAFYKAVRDTLVADDLEQANRIAFGGQRRWRVVTLAGQLIDTSGTMSGGGSKPAKGGMSSKFAAESVRPEVIRQYEEEADDADRGLDGFLREKRTSATDLQDLKKRLPKLEIDISKAELDIQTGLKRIAEAKGRLKELQSQSKPDAGDVKRITSLESAIETATVEVNKLRRSASTIEKEIQALQDKILEIGGTRLRSQKVKVDGIKEMIDLANDQITKAEVGQAKSQKDAEKLDQAIANAEAQLEALKGDVEDLDNLLGACQEDLAGLKEKVDLANEVAEKHTEELSEMKADLDEKTKQINHFRKKEVSLQQKLDLNANALNDERRTIQALEGKLTKLRLEDVDEEDDEDEDNGQKPKADDKNEAENPVKEEQVDPLSVPKRHGDDSLELRGYTDEELGEMEEVMLKGEVAKLEGLIGEGIPNMKALQEWRRREAEFLKRVKDLEAITESRDAKKKRYDDLRKSRLEEFMSGFNTISSKLKEMYQMITLGGNAELELVDSMDPFSEGIIFSVMPPKKSWKNISNLSGGEKTLSSLALVFALHVFKPTPLYFMDEIDAALDFRNVSIVANYIKDRTKNAQFIIISLRNDMFELSHRLIGIYKTSNATRSISIDNKPMNAAQK